MKLAILDRDGTLNPLADDYITSADEWMAVPGALEAIARLNHGGWHVVVATNQPGLGRGLFDVVALNAIHAKMHRQVSAVGGRIDAVFYCPHAADEECACRKPAPGLPRGTWEPGVYDYKDVAANRVGKMTRHWHDEAKVPWLYDTKTGLMISYDDAESMQHKAAFARENKLGGVMIWEISADDVKSTLLDALRAGLRKK